MKFYYVYILKCNDGTFYTGITNNIERRFKEHSLGFNKNCYTYSRRPVEIAFYQEFIDVKQAIFFEKKIKKWSHVKKLAIINDEWEKLKPLSECQNASHSKNNKKE